MKKKILGITLIAVFLAMLIAPAMAGKGNNKLSYEATFRLDSFTLAYRFVPAPPPDANVVFVTVTSPVASLFTLEIAGVTYEPNYDAEMLLKKNVDQDFRTLRATETYTFDGVEGSLVVSVVGRTNNMDTAEQMDTVNVEGHGTGYFEGVKISAKGSCVLGDPTLKIHEGTIMGWPGLPAP